MTYERIEIDHGRGWSLVGWLSTAENALRATQTRQNRPVGVIAPSEPGTAARACAVTAA